MQCRINKVATRRNDKAREDVLVKLNLFVTIRGRFRQVIEALQTGDVDMILISLTRPRWAKVQQSFNTGDLNVILKAQREYWNRVSDGLMGPLSPQELRKHLIEVFNNNNIAIKDETRLLDFGCGVGRIFMALSIYKYQYTGVDIAQNLLKRCGKVVRQNGIVIHLDGYSLPFADNYFDICIAYSVFTHSSKNQVPTMLSQISRVLKEGGIFICTIFEDTIMRLPVEHNWVLLNKSEFTSLGRSAQLKLMDEYQFPEYAEYYQTGLIFRKVASIDG